MKTVLVTGGAGFIGSAVCRHLIGSGNYKVVNVDKLTYAGNLESLGGIAGHKNYNFAQTDICDQAAVAEILSTHRVDAIMHLAAESHVDRSIDGPEEFLQTNVIGTCRLLQAAVDHWKSLPGEDRDEFRFHHVSTDEVFGDLPFDDSRFDEQTPYAPSSPYSASKAASDHFVRAWHDTYGLPVVLSNCSNNYGPFHFPEKLVPLIILNALDWQELPIYGKGDNIRDWLHVEDHARALEQVMSRGQVGESYAIGGDAERTNLEVVETLCEILDRKRSAVDGKKRKSLMRFVTDRPGHDRRYAINAGKIKSELGWSAQFGFAEGMEQTVDWYLGNEWWWRPLREQKYRGERLGVSA